MRRLAVIAVAAVLALAAAGLLPGCGCQKQAVEQTTGGIDTAKDAAAKVSILAIATGVQAYLASTGQAPADASQSTLGDFVSPWPTNPWTQAPMKAGDGVGDYVYTPGSGASYTLAVHLSDGTTYTAP